VILLSREYKPSVQHQLCTSRCIFTVIFVLAFFFSFCISKKNLNPHQPRFQMPNAERSRECNECHPTISQTDSAYNTTHYPISRCPTS
jgi:hypothetical protein